MEGLHKVPTDEEKKVIDRFAELQAAALDDFSSAVPARQRRWLEVGFADLEIVSFTPNGMPFKRDEEPPKLSTRRDIETLTEVGREALEAMRAA